MFDGRTAVIRAALGGALFLLGTASAEAAKCSITTTPIVFGTYNVFTASPQDSTGTVVYNCNGGAKNIWIEISRGISTTFNPRRMAKGTERLNYNLYLDPARTAIWGNSTGGTSVHTNANPPNNHDVTATIYGRIPPGQDISAGAYADVVSVEINF
jgi:spore coat protein U-like protein